nr:hypothetical protein [Tanacetum cinerariifolium]
SNDTEEMVNVLSSMEATNILTSGGAAASVSPGDILPTAGVSTVARQIEEEFDRENQSLSEQLARDSEIARLHAEEELKMMMEGLDRSNELIIKHLREYEQAAAEFFVGEKLELISEIMKYQDHRVKILKYQARQNKPLSKKEQREFYMFVLRSHAGWKTKHFKGMSLEQIKEKFIPVWKQLEDLVPMSSKEESKRVKRQGLKIDQGSSKRVKTSKSVSKEEIKGMMQLVPLEEVYIEALEDLHQLWTLVKETFNTKQATRDKEKELFIILQTVLDEELIEASSLVLDEELIEASSPVKVTITLQAKVVDSNIGNNKCRGAAASVSPADVLPTAGVPTISGSFPTASVIFTTASVKVVESEVPKKRKLQEQIDSQVAREMKEEFGRENQRLIEQLARDFEIERLHAEDELKMMMDGLDRSNEVIAKHLREYEHAKEILVVLEDLRIVVLF